MTFQEAKDYSILQRPDFLARARNIGGQPSYICPHCENGKGKNGTGITMIPRSVLHPTYHCFRCDFTGDIFELAKEHYGLSGNRDAFYAVFEYLGISIDSPMREPISYKPRNNMSQTGPVSVGEVEEEEIDYLEYIKTAADNLDPSYLEERGISEQTQRHYSVGTDKSWVNPKTVERYKKEGKDLRHIRKSPRCIIPTSRHSYLARDIRNNLPESALPYAKQKVGKIHLFNEKYASRADILFVTEGEIDGMSIYEAAGYEPIGLGSTANWTKFVRFLETLSDKKPVILVLDNDDAGRAAADKIIAALAPAGYPVLQMQYNGKDPNNALIEDKAAFKHAIDLSVSEMEKLKKRIIHPYSREDELLELEM